VRRDAAKPCAQEGALSQPYDSDTGLIADGARYYDPDTSTFISPDPILAPTDPSTLNAAAH
jgi:RHS repeat-associated protein